MDIRLRLDPGATATQAAAPHATGARRKTETLTEESRKRGTFGRRHYWLKHHDPRRDILAVTFKDIASASRRFSRKPPVIVMAVSARSPDGADSQSTAPGANRPQGKLVRLWGARLTFARAASVLQEELPSVVCRISGG
jgi:hypothetical protein